MSGLNSKFFALQSPGKRDYQEDDYGLLDARVTGSEEGEHTVIVVADGMGGHVGGALASKLATERFIEAYQAAEGSIPQRLQQALNAANSALTAAIKGNAELKGMGATLVAAVVHDAKLYWISVGDSPMWLFRDKQLQRLNANHSMMPVLQQMVTDGRLTQEQADSDPGRHSLLSALMGEAVDLIDLRAEALALQDEDLLLLASDGLLTLSAEQIAAIMTNGAEQPLAALVNQLHAAIEAAALPGQDNITIALYRATPVSKHAAAAPRRHRSWLLPMCVGLLIIAGLLFVALNSRDRAADAATAEPVPTVPSGAQTTAPPQQAEPSAALPPETGTEPAKMPAEAAEPEAPTSAKQPEGDVEPVPEQDGASSEETQ